MAQRTGDQRLLGSPAAKGASAGLCLALALAVLALAGCGGGSSSGASSEGTSANASTGSSGAAQSDAAEKPTAHGGAGQSQGAGGGDPTSESSSDRSGQGGQKHGPKIVQPKGPPEHAPTPAEIAKATVADMSLTSPSLPAGSEGIAPIPATYTCDGKGSWPAFSWSGVPAGTTELIFYAMNSQPVGGKLFVDWAVAGLDPGLTGIEAAKLPKGAVVGTNSFGKRGYEICPPAGSGEIYFFAVYALPKALAPKPGFDGRDLRKEVLGVSGNVGLYSATYTRE